MEAPYRYRWENQGAFDRKERKALWGDLLILDSEDHVLCSIEWGPVKGMYQIATKIVKSLNAQS